MATATAQGHRLIVEKRRWDDYASLKQYFKNSKTKEILFAGSQLTTAAFLGLDGSDHIIAAQVTAEDVVYLSTIADDATQQGKSVWVIYQDDDGVIHGPIETLLDGTDSSTEIVLGAGALTDTVASVAGDVITMTATAATLNQYAGWYTVGISGNGDQVGVANLIISNTAHGTAPEITLTDTPDANTATDLISIQQDPCDDFYRVREMYCQVEALDGKTIRLGNIDSSAIYAGIGEGHRYMASPNFFTQPAATCASYLGRIRASFPAENTVTVNVGGALQIFYTPKEAHADGGAVETEIEIPFQGEFTWEPCIELEPATDVIIKIKKINDALHDEMFVEASYLEVYK